MPITSEITVKPVEFAAAVGWTAKFVSTKPVVPVHGALVLDIDENMFLTISAFSENVMARAVVDTEGLDDGTPSGRAIVSGRLLDQLAGTFGGSKPVVISGSEDGKALILTSGRFVATLPLMDESEYPAMPAAPPVIGTVAGDRLAVAVAQARVAVHNDDDRGIALMCMHVEFGPEIRIMGTDRYRAAKVDLIWRAGGGVHDLEPATPLGSLMGDAATAFAGPDTVEIGYDGNMLAFTSPTRTLAMRLIDLHDDKGDLIWPAPQLAAGFEQERPHTITIDRAEMAMPLKRAGIVRGKDGPVRVTIGNGELVIGAAEGQTKRDSTDAIDVDYDGEPVVIGFNPDYLAEALKSAPGERVTLHFGDPRKHSTLTCDADPAWRHILMPIRLP